MSEPYRRLRTLLNLMVFGVLSLATAAIVMRSRSEEQASPGVRATLNGSTYPMRVGSPSAHWIEYEAGMNVEGQIEIVLPSGLGASEATSTGISILLSPHLSAGEVGFASYSADGVEVRYVPVFGHDDAHERMLVFSTEGEDGEGILALDSFEPRPGGIVSGTLRRAVLRGHFEPCDDTEPDGSPERSRLLSLSDLSFIATIEE